MQFYIFTKLVQRTGKINFSIKYLLYFEYFIYFYILHVLRVFLNLQIFHKCTKIIYKRITYQIILDCSNLTIINPILNND